MPVSAARAFASSTRVLAQLEDERGPPPPGTRREDVEQRLGVRGVEPPAASARSASGGHREVRRARPPTPRRCARGGAATVPASPRATGPVSAASPKRSAFVERRGEQRCEHAAGFSARPPRAAGPTPGRPASPGGSSRRRGRVVERAALLRVSRPARRPSRGRAPRPLVAARRARSPRSSCRAARRSSADPENVIAGCTRQRERSDTTGRPQHVDAVPTAGVGDQLAAPDRLGGDQPVDQSRRAHRRGPRGGAGRLRHATAGGSRSGTPGSSVRARDRRLGYAGDRPQPGDQRDSERLPIRNRPGRRR